jgi:hypothetical protein
VDASNNSITPARTSRIREQESVCTSPASGIRLKTFDLPVVHCDTFSRSCEIARSGTPQRRWQASHSRGVPRYAVTMPPPRAADCGWQSRHGTCAWAPSSGNEVALS